MGQKKCVACGALLLAGMVVCEHVEPLVEGLLHHGPRAGVYRPAVIKLTHDHAPEAEPGLTPLRLTSEVSQATGEFAWLPSTSTDVRRRRPWHPAYYVTAPVEPILPLASCST
jgi:hypothetical protein